MQPLTQFEHRWQVRWVDTDSSGCAHFSSYVRMMEEAEYAFLRSRGLSVVMRDERGTIGLPRICVKLDIIKPLMFEEWATIRLQLAELDGKQIEYDFAITNQADELAVTGNFVVACCRFPDDKPHYAILIPSHIEAALLS